MKLKIFFIIIFLFIIFGINKTLYSEKLYDLTDFFLSEHQNDIKVWDIYANYAQYMRNDQIIIRDFRFFIYKDGSISSTLIGNKGIVHPNKHVEITDKATIKDRSGIILNTNHINWDNEQLIFYNDTDVIIEQANLRLLCNGIEYNEATGHITFKRNFSIVNTENKNNRVYSDKGEYFVNENLIKLVNNVKIIYDSYVLTNQYSEIKITDNNFDTIKCLNQNELKYLTGNIKSDTILVYFDAMNQIEKINFDYNVVVSDGVTTGYTNFMTSLFKDKNIHRFEIPVQYKFENDSYSISGNKLFADFKNSVPVYVFSDSVYMSSYIYSEHDIQKVKTEHLHVNFKDENINQVKFQNDFEILSQNYIMTGSELITGFFNNRPDEMIVIDIFVEYFDDAHNFSFKGLDDTSLIFISYIDNELNEVNLLGNSVLYNLENDTVLCSNFSFYFSNDVLDKILLKDKLEIVKSNYKLVSDFASYQKGRIEIEDNLVVTEQIHNNIIRSSKGVIENIKGSTFEKIILYNITNTILNF